MRKQYKSLFITSFIACGLLFAGCKKGWIDINYNPIQLTENNATPDIILPNLLISSQSAVNEDWLQGLMGYWAYGEYPTGSPEIAYYPLDNTFIGSATPDINIFLFEQNALRHDQPYYVGIAKALKALQWSRAVDINNNIPYGDVGKVEIRKPRYDDGRVVYEGLMKELDEATTLIKGASQDKAIRIGIADIMFKGDKTKWVKFINTLKLRLLMHQACRTDRAAYIQAEIAKITAEGSGFLNSGEDADVNPGYTDQKPASYFAKYSAFDIYARNYIQIGGNWLPVWQMASANVTAMNMLKENNDPRLAFFYGPARLPMPAGAAEPFTQPGPVEYRGNKLGLPADRLQYPYQQTDYVSQVGGVRALRTAVSPASTGIIKGYNMDSWIITSIESMFLQAEAVYRGWLPGDAETAYKAAVRESFRWLNVGGNSNTPALSDAIFNNWYTQEVANTKVSWAAAPDKYKLLMFQKYMAFNGIEPFESWVDYRRNGAFPAIPLSYDPARTSDKMPIRLPYLVSELLLNKENLLAQGTIDPFTSKIWWMP
ncbi:SusD/RagB family nutrient-binding outer membrane lipoprotein [Chitinophaga sp. SYP-B3965]|uniref:SusD/RagB family nutrient-binding outer membrane lipoprotein n=1 Tax=Chitinophaga sp. SYP-B3965 TaxID=2663120 RepID=UPI00156360BE|nr:SusD/RagB family nutrient-binding outer membrane lipoprotein [Chitinophaga sp. SYP-B3965]